MTFFAYYNIENRWIEKLLIYFGQFSTYSSIPCRAGCFELPQNPEGCDHRNTESSRAAHSLHVKAGWRHRYLPEQPDACMSRLRTMKLSCGSLGNCRGHAPSQQSAPAVTHRAQATLGLRWCFHGSRRCEEAFCLDLGRSHHRHVLPHSYRKDGCHQLGLRSFAVQALPSTGRLSQISEGIKRMYVDIGSASHRLTFCLFHSSVLSEQLSEQGNSNK